MLNFKQGQKETVNIGLLNVIIQLADYLVQGVMMSLALT